MKGVYYSKRFIGTFQRTKLLVSLIILKVAIFISRLIGLFRCLVLCLFVLVVVVVVVVLICG